MRVWRGGNRLSSLLNSSDVAGQDVKPLFCFITCVNADCSVVGVPVAGIFNHAEACLDFSPSEGVRKATTVPGGSRLMAVPSGTRNPKLPQVLEILLRLLEVAYLGGSCCWFVVFGLKDHVCLTWRKRGGTSVGVPPSWMWASQSAVVFELPTFT